MLKTRGGWEVRNKQNGTIHALHTTKTKAEAQIRLLNAIDHGFHPKKLRRNIF